MDANRVRGRKGSTPDAAFRTLWSPPICTVCESRTLTLRRNGGCFDHPVPKKDVRLNIRPRERAKVRRFSKKILKTDLLPYGETWAVLSGCFSNFFFTLRYTEKNMLFWSGVFPKLFLLPPPYGETHALLLTCFPEKICFPDIRPRERGKLNHFSKKD